MLFQHYKTKQYYEVICLSQKETDPCTLLVQYRNKEDGRIWSRPTSDFFAIVADGNGNYVPRFQLIDA